MHRALLHCILPHHASWRHTKAPQITGAHMRACRKCNTRRSLHAHPRPPYSATHFVNNLSRSYLLRCLLYAPVLSLASLMRLIRLTCLTHATNRRLHTTHTTFPWLSHLLLFFDKLKILYLEIDLGTIISFTFLHELYEAAGHTIRIHAAMSMFFPPTPLQTLSHLPVLAQWLAITFTYLVCQSQSRLGR